jgi:hypothetical protein
MPTTIELPESLQEKLRAWASSTNQSEEQVICAALEAYLAIPRRCERNCRPGRRQAQRRLRGSRPSPMKRGDLFFYFVLATRFASGAGWNAFASRPDGRS